MRLILMLLAVVVVLGGGAAGAYFYFTNVAEAALDPDQDHAQLEPEIDPLALSFVEMDPLLVPVVDRDGVSQVVTLIVGLEITNSVHIDKVRSLSPRLKDAYIQEMYGVLNRHAVLKGGTLEVDLIKERLSKISQRILGDDVFYGVKLQAVQQRPV